MFTLQTLLKSNISWSAWPTASTAARLQNGFLLCLETVKAGRAYYMTIVPNNVIYLCISSPPYISNQASNRIIDRMNYITMMAGAKLIQSSILRTCMHCQHQRSLAAVF